MLTTALATLLLAHLALSTPTPSASPSVLPYIGLQVYAGTVQAPCAPSSLSFNLKPPTTWLNPTTSPPSSHCLPGLPGAIHNITCVTRRTVALPGDDAGAFQTKLNVMAKCDMWGFTETGCQGKYWVAGRGDPLASVGRNGSGSGQETGAGLQSWIWTEEEREAGPDLLDVRSWQIDCRE